jgi:hypothetical protein
MRIISADERLKTNTGIKGVIFGAYKIGKTSLLWTLPPDKTLFIDMEAGGLSVEGWEGDRIEINDWREARDIACLIGGANQSLRSDENYSDNHYSYAESENIPKIDFTKYDTIFIDSITQASRLAFYWSKGQPESYSEKTGKLDLRKVYGTLGQEMIAWITQFQHCKKNVWFVGLLDEKLDEFNRVTRSPQIEGQKTGLELPGIVDQVITLAEISASDEKGKNEPFRAFICTKPNIWGYPAGDRSGKLEMIEQPHLGRLMDKIRNGERLVKLNYEIK